MKQLITAFLCLISFFSSAQTATDTLQAFGTSPDLYLYHTVQKGETFFSLGRMFHVAPYEIAKANGLTFDSSLRLYSFIKIPLNDNNFDQRSLEIRNGYVPVFHKVISGETLYHIGLDYNKVPLQNIRNWNHISGNDVNLGQYLIIGYVKYNGNSIITPAIDNSMTVTMQPAKKETSVPYNTSNSSNNIARNTKNTAAKNNDRLVIPPPIMTRSDSGIVTDNMHSASPDMMPNTGNIIPVNNNDDGPFEAIYMQQASNKNTIATEQGAGTWFSSNIPVGSKKYYVLFDSAARGEVIKITNPLNGNYIYAKVLDVIPKLGENANTIVKISDAAKTDLGVNSPRFFCRVEYVKE